VRTLAVTTFVFTKGGWAVNYFDEEMMNRISEAAPYELLLGRGTYEIFAAHWPYDEGPIADHLNSTRKHVGCRRRRGRGPKYLPAAKTAGRRV
jgi:dihydrofolate reductase